MAQSALFALLLLIPSSGLAQTISAPRDARTKVDNIFEKYNRTDSPGCAVGVSLEDAPILSAAYGMADLEHGVALTPDSIFEPGSVTKQFTAAAVLLLARSGKISLDDPVRKYIPELPDYGTPITIRHLINHTSGLRDWGNIQRIAGWPRTTRAYTHANVLEIVSSQKSLNYPPGAEYSYTNTGYNLSAILVARVAGQSLPDFTKETIFTPLGMTSTSWRDDFQRIVKNRAMAYQDDGTGFRSLMPFENVFGNGGLLTTVGDLLRWNRNFKDAKVGGREFVDAQQQRGRLTDGRTIAYAGGLRVTQWRGVAEVSHSGSTAGYQAWLGRYPDQRLSVAVLCNVTSAAATRLGHQVAAVYLRGVIKEDKSTFQPGDVSALAGLYSSIHDHGTIEIRVNNGSVQLDRRGALIPISANVFTSGEDGPRVEFQKDSTGAVRRVLLGSEAEENVYERVEPAKLTKADFEALTGEYLSDEAGISLRVVFENDGLTIRRKPDSSFALRPTYKDAFSSPLGSVRFIRDSNGRVREMSIGDSRVWDLRFRRSQ